MARQQIPVSPYDRWLKEVRDTHTDAAANVERIDREIATKTAEIDALFAERADQLALRDHTAHTIELSGEEYREKASRAGWHLTKYEEPPEEKEDKTT